MTTERAAGLKSRRKPSASPASAHAAAPAAGKAGYHHGNLAEALLDGGLHLLRTRSIDGLTLRECAKLAGVSQAAIRNHFPDKHALLAGLAERGFHELAQRRGARQQTGTGLVGWLHVIIENYVAFAVDCPDLFRLMFALKSLKRSAYPALNAAAQVSYDALSAAFDAALKTERVRLGDIDAARFTLWSCMHGTAMLLIDEPYGAAVTSRARIEARCLQLAELLAAGWRSGIHPPG